MDLAKGYINLYRQFLEWEWYDDANTMRLFIHCLLLANYKNKKWRGKTIERGQFITSQPKLANSLKLSIMQIRNSLNKLKTTGEITVSTTADYSIITVKNYNLYQDVNSLNNSLISENQQANNSLTTTTNKDKKDKKDNISLSIEERENLKKYLSVKKKNIQDKDAYIRKLIDNGDINLILEKAHKWQEKQQEKVREVNEYRQRTGRRADDKRSCGSNSI